MPAEPGAAPGARDRATGRCREGEDFLRQGRLDDAAAAFSESLALDAGSLVARAGLAQAEQRRGRSREAAAHYRWLLEREPRNASLLTALGLCLEAMEDAAGAEDCFRRAVALTPPFDAARIALARILARRHEHHAASVLLREVLSRDPENHRARGNHALSLVGQGLVAEAIAEYDRILARDPNDRTAGSNRLLAMAYLPEIDPLVRRAAAVEWGNRLTAGRRPLPPAIVDRDPDRPLRVGYVSGDLRGHPVGFYLAAVLPHHDRANFAAICYANRTGGDGVTAMLRKAAAGWREVAALDDAALADRIRADRIDILIDLSGHTAGNRLGCFALKPAPLAMSWIGYGGTVGLATIDRIVADRRLLRPSETGQFLETPLWLPDSYVTFAPPPGEPPVGPPPMLAGGRIAFGCFNNATKIGPKVVRLWGRLLRAVPDATLELRTGAFGETATAERFRTLFAAEGIEAGRLRFAGHSDHAALLAAYGGIDIALDPFPFNGGITTVEALRMGVPVVSLEGRSYYGHHAESSLAALGLGELVAPDEAAYVATAVALAGDPARLANLRAGMRERFARTTLGDNPRFVRDFEAGLRQAWRDWCGR